MAIALVATILAATAGVDASREVGGARRRRHGSRLDRAGAHRRRHGHRCRDRPRPGAQGRDDRDARAHRDAAQLRRPRRGPRRLELLVRGDALPRHPLGRGHGRRLHRCGDLHRLDRRVPQAVGADQVGAADAPRPQLDQPRGDRRPSSCSRSSTCCSREDAVALRASAARSRHRHRAGARAGTSSPRSAAATCRSSSRCSTATRGGRRPRRASSSATTCSSSPARSSAPPVRTCPTSCAGP